MATLKSLRNRIGAIHSTKKITKAMKLISSAKYLSTKNTLNDALPYYKKIEAIAKNLLIELDEDTLKECPYINSQGNLDSSKAILLIVITSNKGLCGSFNINVIKALTKKTAELDAKEQEYRILCIGNKGFELIKKHYSASIIEKVSLTISAVDIENFGNKLVQIFYNNESANCYLIYNEYKPHAANHTAVHSLLPYEVPVATVQNVELKKRI